MKYVEFVIIIAIAFIVVAFLFRNTEDNSPTIGEGIGAIERTQMFLKSLQNFDDE